MTLKALTVIAVVAGIAELSGAVSAQTFGYFGAEGPPFWGELSRDWSACGGGKIQSPVDFRLPHPPQPRKLSLAYGDTTGEILNNGHTIEVETEGRNILTLAGVAYQLKQFHFHSVSEHRVDAGASTWRCTWCTRAPTDRMPSSACFWSADRAADRSRRFSITCQMT